MATKARLSLVALVLSAACHGAGGRDPGDAKSAAEASAELKDAGRPEDVVSLAPVLADPRFADARALEDAGKHLDAANALEADLAKVELAGAAKCAASYMLGRLRTLAGDDTKAAAAMDGITSGEPSCVLIDYARLRAAAAWERMGKADEAITRAQAVAAPIALADESKLVLAEAFAARGDRNKAVPIWREHLAKHPRGTRWVDTAARLASALLDGVDGEAKDKAKEAHDLATHIMIEGPTFEDSVGAPLLRKRAVQLDAALPRDLSTDERIRRARALLDGNHADKAHTEIDAAIAAIPAKERAEGSEIACRAETARAQVMAKHKAGKGPEARADAWGDAMRACAKETDALASALFNGAKASLGAQRPDEALDRYGRVEKAFPKHRLADDSRLAAAMITRDRGDVAKFETSLLALPDDYPDGDMRGEALFRVALERMGKGDWEGAKAPLDRGAEIDLAKYHWATAGRAAYFRAKVAMKTGDAADAKKRWTEVMKKFPLAFYMAQSYARVEEQEAGAAKATVDVAVLAEPKTPVMERDHPEMRKPEFARAVALLEVGEFDAARKEFLASGALIDAAEPELVWVVASLFDRAGAPDIGHSFARGRLVDYLEHYPAGHWRFAWEAAFPRAFAPDVEHGATETHLPAPLVWAIMREESAFIADVRSPSNAHGLMQLLPSTAREVARGTSFAWDDASLHQPQTSIALGTKLLAGLRASFPTNPTLAIPSYNAGAGAVKSWLKARPGDDFDLWIEQIPFEETRGYIKRVLASQLAYATLYEPAATKEVLALPARAEP